MNDLAGKHLVVRDWAYRYPQTGKSGYFDWDIAMPPKKTVTSVLRKAGTIEFSCRFHPNMKATLVVTP